MDRPINAAFRMGPWRVDPSSGQMSRDGAEALRLEGRTMRLLAYLAERPGETVSIDELLEQVWSGVIVTPESVYQAVASLRRLLGDDPKQPTYIATVPRLGYRMVAAVSPWMEPARQPTALSPGLGSGSATSAPSDARAPRPRRLWAGVTRAAGPAFLALFMGVLIYSRSASDHPAASASVTPSERSIAVLPFLDLTEGMNEEPFADGMTEELIGKLSKISGLRVPSPTASFYFKGKRAPVADIAKSLGVAYVLDGSVRKSGGRLRVAARLVRAESGFVVWSETYDRLFDDILMVQDDIAGEVAKALQASIG